MTAGRSEAPLHALRPWFEGRRVLVVGLGKSGVAAARLLRRAGARVHATDDGDASALAPSLRALPSDVVCEIGSDRFLSPVWDWVIPSPGVPPAVWRRAVASGTRVWGELELAYRALRGMERWPSATAAITGTNGKTTATALLGAMARADGRRTVVAGNIGTPLCDVVDQIDGRTTLVLEVSSYQLETATAFRPAVGAVLNVTPDHLGRHGTLARYAAAKFRLFQAQGPGDAAVLNRRDPWCRRLASTAPGRVVWFEDPGGVSFDGRRLIARWEGGKESWAPPARLPGRHNIENAEAALACARRLGVSPAAVDRALRSFPGVEHRLEEVRRWRGVRFVNDSKATNVDSTAVALKAFPGGLRLILGGEHKGSPYTPLRGEVRRKVREILLIGEAAPRIARDLRGAAPLAACGDLASAVRRAAATARPGETVLLSPACASFDQFKNFEDRGRRFKALVEALR